MSHVTEPFRTTEGGDRFYAMTREHPIVTCDTCGISFVRGGVVIKSADRHRHYCRYCSEFL